MLSLVKSWFETPEQAPALAPEYAAAALLFEVIRADHSVTDTEVSEMLSLLEQTFALDAQQMQELQLNIESLHANAVGLHEFTTVLNQHLSAEQKVQIVRAMWRVAHADQRIDPLEEHVIRRAADLLYVSHRQFISAKLAAREAFNSSS